MPTRQALVAAITRRYPFYSGCGTLANHRLIRRLAGVSSTHLVWAQVPGGEVQVDLNEYVGRAAYYVGDLDRKITWICAQIVQEGDIVLDIGANVGLLTVWLSRLVGPRGKVFAFEPNPTLQRRLESTIGRNQIANVVLSPVALGRDTTTMQLRVPKDNSGKGSLIREFDSADIETISVPVIRLSDFVVTHGITSIGLLKIDVEGFEDEVFQGALEVLERIPPQCILFEMNNPWKSGVPLDEPVFRTLNSLGYGFFRIPRCLWRMRLERFEPEVKVSRHTHDFLAVPRGKSYERIALAVGA
jgi:FkbM family methyltransferase